MHIQATVKRVKGQCGFGRLVRIDILATLGLAFYIPAGEPEIQALIVSLVCSAFAISGSLLSFSTVTPDATHTISP